MGWAVFRSHWPLDFTPGAAWSYPGHTTQPPRGSGGDRVPRKPCLAVRVRSWMGQGGTGIPCRAAALFALAVPTTLTLPGMNGRRSWRLYVVASRFEIPFDTRGAKAPPSFTRTPDPNHECAFYFLELCKSLLRKDLRRQKRFPKKNRASAHRVGC